MNTKRRVIPETRAQAGIASARGSAGEPETELTTHGRGARYAGPGEVEHRVVVVVPPTLEEPGKGPTAYAREKHDQYCDAVRRLRRVGSRGASLKAIASRVGVDRGTLADWIERGWYERPEDVPAR